MAIDRKLNHTPREKAAMDVYDVREVAQTTITTTEKKFKVGRYRIQTNYYRKPPRCYPEAAIQAREGHHPSRC
jgi:hypothetical protein